MKKTLRIAKLENEIKIASVKFGINNNKVLALRLKLNLIK